ncbi:MAG TPA: MFS transporter, partial [Chloroflexota bacterium]|nr:MFS transporter [Chloroflexota bacterium]
FLTGILAPPFLGATHPSAPWALGSVYLIALLTGSCAQFFTPAEMGMLADIVPEADLPRAAGMNQAATSLTMLIGPPLATVLFFAIGPGPALIFNALSFVVSWLAIRALRMPVKPEARSRTDAGFRHELLEGLRYFTGNRTLTTVLIAAVMASLGSGALNTLDIFFLTRNLHAPLRWYGALSAIDGAGLLIGSLLAGTVAAKLGIRRAIWLGLLTLGVLFIFYSRLSAFAPAAVIIFLVGFPSAVVNASAGPLILSVTPDRLVGRVFSVLIPCLTLSSLLSMAVAGYLASSLSLAFHVSLLGIRWGTIDSIFTGTGLLLVASGLYAAARLHDGSSAGATP